MEPDLSQLTEPWVPVGESANAGALVSELLSEVPPGHLLSGKSVAAIARRIDRDDVLFSVGGAYAVVHLTYSPRRETEPTYPLTEMYVSWVDFISKRAVPDSEEYRL